SFLTHTGTTDLSTLSLHDALPIFGGVAALVLLGGGGLYMTLQKPTATQAEKAAPPKAADQAEGEAGHADEGETPEGVVELSAERSEEHTSELQSRENLVCRLLLEK